MQHVYTIDAWRMSLLFRNCWKSILLKEKDQCIFIIKHNYRKHQTMREHNKRWLISVMKTSGSKRQYVINGRYADERHLQKQVDPEDLPTHQSIKSTQKFYNGKINYGLLVRFLRGQVGNNWDQIYSEILNRIPTKLLDYKEMIFWFVADKVEFIDGRPWNKKTQKFIWTGEQVEPVYWTQIKTHPERKEFYVHPETNKLVRIEQKSPKRLTE